MKGSKTEMSLKAALKDIKSGKLLPIYICYGSEAYLLQSFVGELTERIATPELREFAVSRYDLNETPLDAVLDDAETFPFMSERKLVIARSAVFFSAAKDTSKVEHRLDRLAAYIKSPVEFTTIVFILSADKLDERKKIVKQLKDMGATLAFAPLNEHELDEWTLREAGQRGIAFADGAKERLLLSAGGSLQSLDQELEKLSLHVGRGGTVTVEQIDQLVARTTEQNVFLMIDELVKRRLDKAVDMFHELLKQKEEPIKIVVLLARQFRMMYQVKELERMGYSQQQIAGQVGAHPYAVKLASEHARRYESAELTALLARLAELDFRIKSGRADKVMALELFILQMAG